MSSVTRRHRSSTRDSDMLLRYTQARSNIDTGDDDYRRDDDNGNERVRLGFALLMIPSLMFMFYSNNKFNSKSNSNIDFSALAAHGFPGMGGRSHIPDEIRAMYDDKFRETYEQRKRDRYLGYDRYYERDRYLEDRYARDRYERRRYARNRYLAERRYDEEYRRRQIRDKRDDHHDDNDVPRIGEASADNYDDNQSKNDNKNSDDESTDKGALKPYDENYEKQLDKNLEVDLENKEEETRDLDTRDLEPRDAYDGFDDDRDRYPDDLDYPYHPAHRYGRGYGGGYGGGYGVGFPGMHGLDHYDHYHSSRDWDRDPHLDVDTEYPMEYPPYRRRKKKKPEEKKKEEGPYKVILFWDSKTLAKTDLPIGTKSFENAKCFQKSCVITADRNYLPIADALVFGADDDFSNIPSSPSLNQKWIFHGLNPPVNRDDDLSKLQNLINLRWTYTQDSDIIYSTAKIEILNQHNSEYGAQSTIDTHSLNAFNIWRKKKRMIAFVDNACETNSQRETYVEMLKKHIDLDVFGDCVLKPCSGEACLKKLEEDYLFVLIIEEYLCPDYVSNAIFDVLQHNIVPVVLGNVDYTKITPTASVIDAFNFTSHKDLADYLNAIGTEYNIYKVFFEWKRHHRICYVRDDLCHLCALLHQKPDARRKPTVFPDIDGWWKGKAKCASWSSFVPHNLLT